MRQMDACLMRRIAVDSQERGTTWGRGTRGGGINQTLMEEVASERNLKGCVQLQQAELMPVCALSAFPCDLIVGISGRGRSRKRDTKAGAHRVCSENRDSFRPSQSSSSVLVAEEMPIRLERRLK